MNDVQKYDKVMHVYVGVHENVWVGVRERVCMYGVYIVCTGGIMHASCAELIGLHAMSK